MTDTESANVQTARRYPEAISRGAPWSEVAAFFTEDVVQEEFPNRLVPAGAPAPCGSWRRPARAAAP